MDSRLQKFEALKELLSQELRFFERKHPDRPELNYVNAVGYRYLDDRGTIGLVVTIRPETPQEMFDLLPREYRGERITYERDTIVAC